MTFTKTLLPALLLSIAFTPAMAADEKIVDVKKEAQDFVHDASLSNMFEIESSKLALTRSKDADVRNFAQHMIADHSKAGGQMKAAVAKSKLKLIVNKTLDEEHQEKITALKEAEDFDAAYIDAQQKAHSKTIDLFEDYAEDDDANPALKEFAIATLPALKSHKDMIEKVDDEE